MARKKDSPPWMLIGAVAAGLWWLFGSPASAATQAAPARWSTAQSYMNQLMAAQNAFLQGSQTQVQYASQAGAIIARAAIDPGVSGADLANLRAVAGS